MIRSLFLLTVLLFRTLSRYFSYLSSLSILFSQSPPKEHKDFLLAGCASQKSCIFVDMMQPFFHTTVIATFLRKQVASVVFC